MKINEKAMAALQDPDTREVAIEMTPERKQRYSRIAAEVVDLLKTKTEGPLESYMILQFVTASFEEMYGFRGGYTIENGESKH